MGKFSKVREKVSNISYKFFKNGLFISQVLCRVVLAYYVECCGDINCRRKIQKRVISNSNELGPVAVFCTRLSWNCCRIFCQTRWN